MSKLLEDDEIEGTPGDGRLPIPIGVVDFASFRRWAISEDYPRQGKFSWLNGKVWMDLSIEPVLTHNAAKNAFLAALIGHVDKSTLGHLLSGKVLVSSEQFGLSTEPDALFVSYKLESSGKVRFREDVRTEIITLVGIPDMTLEVVSETSVTKDTVDLKSLYYQAGVREYWVVDARRGTAKFTILRRTTRGYIAVQPSADGYCKSTVFRAGFRLRVELGPTHRPIYRVTIKE